MRSTGRTRRLLAPEAAEAWWPLQDLGPTSAPRQADHEESGWWDPGAPERTRLAHARGLVDALAAGLPAAALHPGAVVVELGCGPGLSLQELACRGVTAQLHGWEPDPAAAAAAAVICPEATLHPGPVPHVVVPDGSADVVWVPVALARGEHDESALLAEAHRLLRPGGHLAAVTAGPGVWRWERPGEPWDEDGTGLLVLALDRLPDRGGPVRLCSRWWRDEHWGRGFSRTVDRPAGVTMLHPDAGYGLSVWRRDEGAALPAAAFAAFRPGDARAGRAVRRQLALAHEERRRDVGARTAALQAARERVARLAAPGAVDDDPRVREALRAVEHLEREVQEIRSSRWWRAGRPLRTAYRRLTHRPEGVA